jgi:phage terminase large subunit-like protein
VPEVESRIGDLDEPTASELFYNWPSWARDDQLPPPGDWVTWLLLGGRGSGKTRAGAEWVRAQATGPAPVSPIALVGETMAEAIATWWKARAGCCAFTRPKRGQN